MSIGITKLFENGESLMDQRRLMPAIEVFEHARRMTQIPDRRAWATYNLGCIHWARVGDGDAARREFLAAIKDFEVHGYGKAPEMFKAMHASALENAMLCALSYDEFFQLADRLRKLQPGAPILNGLVPRALQSRNQGDPWSDVLLLLASSYYNRSDPQLDPGRYGEAKSTYHLLIVHRRELRLSQQDWSTAVGELCRLALRLASDCLRIRGGDNDPNSPEEYLPIVTGAATLAAVYLQTHPGDRQIQDLVGKCQKFAGVVRAHWQQVSRSTSGGSGCAGSTRVLLFVVVCVAMACSAVLWLGVLAWAS